MGVGRILPGDEAICGFFPEVSMKIFPRGAQKVVNFHFFLSKLRKRPFFAKHTTEKCQISKSRKTRPPVPPSDAHEFEDIFHFASAESIGAAITYR